MVQTNQKARSKEAEHDHCRKQITTRSFNKLHLWIRRLGNCKSDDWSHPEAAEKFYCELAAPGKKVRVGMEASGQTRWFERTAGGTGTLNCG